MKQIQSVEELAQYVIAVVKSISTKELHEQMVRESIVSLLKHAQEEIEKGKRDINKIPDYEHEVYRDRFIGHEVASQEAIAIIQSLIDKKV